MKVRIRNHHNKYKYDLSIMEKALTITEDKFKSYKDFYTEDYIKYFHGVLNNLLYEA
jgi:hypothetical protein